MNNYILFLIFTFVMAGVAPKIIRRPWFLTQICVLLCLSFYSPRFF